MRAHREKTCLVVVPLEDEKLKEAEAELSLKTQELVRLQAILKECRKSHCAQLISATQKELEETKKKLEWAHREVEELKKSSWSKYQESQKHLKNNQEYLRKEWQEKREKVRKRTQERIEPRKSRRQTPLR